MTRQRDDYNDDEEKSLNLQPPTHYESMLTHPSSLMHDAMLNDNNNAEMSVDEDNEQDEDKFELFDMTACGNNKQNQHIENLSKKLDEVIKNQMSIAIIHEWQKIIRPKLTQIIQYWFKKQQDNETINKLQEKFYGLSRSEMTHNFFHFLERYKLGVMVPVHTTIDKCPAKGFCRLHQVTDEDANKLAQEYLYGPHNDYKTKYTSKTHYICWLGLWNNHQCGEYGIGTPAIIQGSISVVMKHLCKVDNKGEMNLCPHSKDWTVLEFIFKNIFYAKTWQTIYYNQNKRTFDNLIEELFNKCTFSTKLLNESIKSAQKKNYYYPTKSQKRKQKKNPPQHRYQVQPNYKKTKLPPPKIAPARPKISPPNKDQKTKPTIKYNGQDIIFNQKSKILFLRPKLNGKVEQLKARKCFQNNNSYWNLYETLSPINVSIFNRTGKINCKCYFGKEREEECQLKVIGYVAIPVGDLEKFFILRSPLTKCSKHFGTISKLYGFANAKEKLYLGLYAYIYIYLYYYYHYYMLKSLMMIRPIALTRFNSFHFE